MPLKPNPICCGGKGFNNAWNKIWLHIFILLRSASPFKVRPWSLCPLSGVVLNHNMHTPAHTRHNTDAQTQTTLAEAGREKGRWFSGPCFISPRLLKLNCLHYVFLICVPLTSHTVANTEEKTVKNIINSIPYSLFYSLHRCHCNSRKNVHMCQI